MDEINNWWQCISPASSVLVARDVASNSTSSCLSSKASDDTSITSDGSLSVGCSSLSIAPRCSKNLVGHGGTVKDGETVAKTVIGANVVGKRNQIGSEWQHYEKMTSQIHALNKLNESIPSSASAWSASGALNHLDDHMDHFFDDSISCWNTTINDSCNNLANSSSVWNTPPIHKDDVLPDLYSLPAKIIGASRTEGSVPIPNTYQNQTPTRISGSTDHQLLSPSSYPIVGNANTSAMSVSASPNSFSTTVRQDVDLNMNSRIAVPVNGFPPKSQSVFPAVRCNGTVGSPLSSRSFVSGIVSRNDALRGSSSVPQSSRNHTSFQSPTVPVVHSSDAQNMKSNSSFVKRTTRPWTCENEKSINSFVPRSKHFRRNLNSQWALWPTNNNKTSCYPENDGTDCLGSESDDQNNEQLINLATEMNGIEHFSNGGNANNMLNSAKSTVGPFADNGTLVTPDGKNSYCKNVFPPNPQSSNNTNQCLNQIGISNPKMNNTSNVAGQMAIPPPHHTGYCSSPSAKHHSSGPIAVINGREFQDSSNGFGGYHPVNSYHGDPVYSGPSHEFGSAPIPMFGFFGDGAAPPAQEPFNGARVSPWSSPQSKDHRGRGVSPPSQVMQHQETDLVSLMCELAIEQQHQQQQQCSDALRPRWTGGGQFPATGGYGRPAPSDGVVAHFMAGDEHLVTGASAGTGCFKGGSVMAMTASMEGVPSCSPPGDTGTAYSPTKGCVFCKNNGYHSTFYKSHVLKDERGHCACPVLRTYVCPLCQGSGDAAHTLKYCPLNTVTKGDPIAAGLPPGKVTNWRDVANKMPHINYNF